MSVFNGMPYLHESIESVLTQDFDQFELIVIDDCSTDGTLEYLESIKDTRMRIINNEINLGLSESLNKGIKISKGKYIARLDADDIAHKNRLWEQYIFLEQNPNIGLLGTGYNEIDKDNQIISIKVPIQVDYQLRWFSLFRNPFVHSSIMLRKCILDNYDIKYPKMRVAQDYHMWNKIMEHTKAANLSTILISHRIHSNRISNYAKDQQRKNVVETSLYYIERRFQEKIWTPLEIKNLIDLYIKQKIDFPESIYQTLNNLLFLFKNYFQNASTFEENKFKNLQKVRITKLICDYRIYNMASIKFIFGSLILLKFVIKRIISKNLEPLSAQHRSLHQPGNDKYN